MIREFKIQAAVLLLFAVLAFVHLHPLPLHLSDAANDLDDSLLNAWILSWDQTALRSHPGRIFDTNAFYPHRNTLSYSEHLFPPAVASLPVALAARNPLFVHNLLLFLFFALNGWTMYLLVRSLTGDHAAGIIGGVMFAFNPYQLQHLAHLQLLSSWCLPLSFLFLHRFFAGRRRGDAWLFSFFFLIQALSSVYYGLFFISILAVALPVLLLLHARSIKAADCVRLAIPLAVSAGILFLMTRPYLSMFRTFDFKRDLAPGADLMNYLATQKENVLYGSFLNSLGQQERFLFPGLAALLLALLFVVRRGGKTLRLVPKIARTIPAAAILIGAAGIMILAATGGFELSLGPFSIKGHHMDRYVLAFCLGSALLLLASFLAFLKRKNPETDDAAHLFLYAFVMIWSLFLSFGSTLYAFGKPVLEKPSRFPWLTPFRWFYDFFPGFKGIRVPSRYAVFVVFGIAVMAGFGYVLIRDFLKKKAARIAVALFIFGFVNAEYYSAPQRIRHVPSADRIPAYPFVKGLPESSVLLELPFLDPISRDSLYMHFSSFHRKNIVNGYSGFIPPGIFYIREVFRFFPSWDCLEILSALGVDFLLVHPKSWGERNWTRIRDQMRAECGGIIEEVRSFPGRPEAGSDDSGILGDEVLYRFQYSPPERPRFPGQRELSPEIWRPNSDFNPELLPLLKDGRIDTAWGTPGPKSPDNTLTIEFPEPENVSQIQLCLDPRQAYSEFAVGLEVMTSADGVRWTPLESVYAPGEFVRGLIDNPKNPVQKIYLDGRPARAIWIHQLGHHRYAPWSIAEIRVFVKP